VNKPIIQMTNLLFLILLLQSSNPLVQANTGEITETNNLEISYLVVNSSETNNFWYHPNDSAIYIVETDSLINLTVNNLNEAHSNLNIEIGNLTKTAINDDEIENNLAFGYYFLGNQLGIIANTSWNELKTDFNQLNFNSSSFNIQVISTYLGGEIETVTIYLKDNFQETSLTYSYHDGLLLYAKSGFGMYYLEIEIYSINNSIDYFKIPDEDGSFLTFPFGYVFLFIISSISIIKKIKKKIK